MGVYTCMFLKHFLSSLVLTTLYFMTICLIVTKLGTVVATRE